MPNGIQHTTGSTPTGCLRKGNILIANNLIDYGTSFFSGITPPSGGYSLYLNKASGGPSIYWWCQPPIFPRSDLFSPRNCLARLAILCEYQF